MKYCSGDDVRLLDKVELLQGGKWVSATVVFIDESKEAVEGLNWLLENTPEWAVGCIAVRWDDYYSIKPLFFATAEAAEASDASILFTDTYENEEMRFVSRS